MFCFIGSFSRARALLLYRAPHPPLPAPPTPFLNLVLLDDLYLFLPLLFLNPTIFLPLSFLRALSFSCTCALSFFHARARSLSADRACTSILMLKKKKGTVKLADLGYCVQLTLEQVPPLSHTYTYEWMIYAYERINVCIQIGTWANALSSLLRS